MLDTICKQQQYMLIYLIKHWDDIMFWTEHAYRINNEYTYTAIEFNLILDKSLTMNNVQKK